MVALRGDEILDGRTAGMALELASLLVQPLQGSEPKGIGEPPLQLVTPIVMHDGLRHHGAKARHPVGKPARNMSAVQRQIGASGPARQEFRFLAGFGATAIRSCFVLRDGGSEQQAFAPRFNNRRGSCPN